MVHSQVKISSRYCPNSPFSFRRECLPLIVASGSYNYLVSVFINGSGGGSC